MLDAGERGDGSANLFVRRSHKARHGGGGHRVFQIVEAAQRNLGSRHQRLLMEKQFAFAKKRTRRNLLRRTEPHRRAFTNIRVASAGCVIRI